MKKIKLLKLLIFIVILILSLLIIRYSSTPLKKTALSIADIKYEIREKLGLSPSADDNIVIVEIDEKSVNHLGRWPWDRNIIGDLIEKLSPSSIIALDIVFSEKSSEEKDRYLAKKISQSGNVIGGFFFRSQSTEKTKDYILDYLYDQAIFRITMESETTNIKEFPFAEPNIPTITDALLANAFFTIEPDPDGLYRKYPLAYIFKGMLIPSLATQTLRYHLNKDIEVVLNESGIKSFTLNGIDIKNHNYIRLNYYKDANFISAYDVLSGKIPPEFFKNKITLVGVTEIGIYDLRPTPINSVTPGVLLHLTAINNLVNNEYLKDIAIVDIVIIIGILATVFLGSFLRKIYIRVILYISIIFLFYTISNIIFIKFHIWINDFYYLFPAVILSISLELLAFFIVDRKSLEMKKAFSTYVSPEIVNIMMQDPEKLSLGGEEREITIMFTDIRGFTTISEQLSSKKVVSILNRLNSPLTECIIEHKGLLDKYIGDAIMAIFNAPVDIDNHADLACEAALEMMEILEKTNASFENDNLPKVDIGIGLNTGIATVGNIGSSLRFDYTAIGDSVNLASRLESLNKLYKTHIIISEFTAVKLTKPFILKKLDRVRVKGKKKPVEIYELLKPTKENADIAEHFNKAIMHYFNADFQAALEEFKLIHNIYKDNTAKLYIERCEAMLNQPVEKNWDGVFTAQTK